MSELHYTGEELELFREAVNWKRYFGRRLQPWIRGRVLEVGAGLGETTPYLLHGEVSAWTCLEPDPNMKEHIREKIAGGVLPALCTARLGTTESLQPHERFDTIVYIDVLEHIAGDRAEMERASQHLEPGGRILVLSPAYPWLYTAFDQAIGHFRRYSRETLRQAGDVPGLELKRIFFMESMGILLLLVNKLLMRKPYPTIRQVLFWDRMVVPLSRITDSLFFHSFGKTIVGIFASPLQK